VKKAFFLSLLLAGSLFGALVSSEKEFIAKIASLITIGDTKGARRVGFLTKELYPTSKSVLSLYIRTLAADGYLKEALTLLPEITGDKEVREHFSTLEAIGWNYLLHEEGMSSVSNIASLLGAYRTQDARCVHLLLNKLNSSNAYDRHLAVKLSMSYQDLPLTKKLTEMLVSEKNYFVKLMLIEAAGKMKIAGCAPLLKQIIDSNALTIEERCVAIKSLIQLSDKPKKEEILQLKGSSKTTMRRFCAALITHFELHPHTDILIDFLSDRHPTVRAQAILGLMILETPKEVLMGLRDKIIHLVHNDTIEVSELAKIPLLLIDQERGLEAFSSSLLGSDPIRARFASRVIGYTGSVARPLIQTAFIHSKDPIVKANLSLAMMGKDIDSPSAISYLSDFLKEYKEKIMIRGEFSPFFIGIDDSLVRHIPYIPNYPTLVDSMTRLQLLSKLSILKAEGVQEAMRAFLKNKMGKVSSSAAIMMLEDSKLEDMDLLRELLNDKDPVVRLQAALVLAFYGNDSTVTYVLEEAYNSVDWEKKMMILEAIGVIGNRTSIPFVIDKMKKESFILQKLAAATLLQCLYH
jgi:HEAT repeat protein